MLSTKPMCSAGHALRTMFRLKKQALLHKASSGNPLELTMKRIFFSTGKRKRHQQGAQTDPEAAAGSVFWSAASEKQMLHRNFMFHEMAKAQHCTEQTVNKVPPSLSAHTIISIFQTQRFYNRNSAMSIRSFLSSCWSKRHCDSAKATEYHGAMAAMVRKASLLLYWVLSSTLNNFENTIST